MLDVRYDALKGHVRGLGVHRAALFDVLHDAVVAAGIEVRTGSTIVSREVGGDGRARLMTTDGRSFGPFDLVIDALGSTSPLKVFARRKSHPRALEFGALWGTVPWVDEGFDRRALLQRYEKAAVMIGVLPIGRRTIDGPALAAFFWSLKVGEYEALKVTGLTRVERPAAWTVAGHGAASRCDRQLR